MVRKQIAAGNWKMNTTVSEGEKLLNELKTKSIPSDVEVIIGVPHTHLDRLHTQAGTQIKIAAQNCHHKESGAYTGEVSTKMLTDLGVSIVILGHSERRQYNNESHELLKAKLDAALAAGLRVVFCCGEPLEVRKAQEQDMYVATQLNDSLLHLSEDDMKNIVIAYEPIWAIGTGETATPAQAQDMHKHIRSIVSARYGDRAAANLSILYGGSVKPANAKELFSQPDVDGGLVGGASLNADRFTEIIQSF